MDPMSILNTLLQAIQSISLILIILGLLIAFLWKAAFYFNLALGMVVTTFVTYFVNIGGNNIETTATIFFIGLVCTLFVAAIGGILCLLEGFVFSSLGIWMLWIAGSPPSILSITVITESAVLSLILTGVAAYVGDKALSIGTFSRRRSANNKQSLEEPVSVEILPEDQEPRTNNETRILLEKKKGEPDTQTRTRIFGYVKAYREFQLEVAAKRFELTRDQIEEILLDLLAEGKISGSIDAKTDKFTLEPVA